MPQHNDILQRSFIDAEALEMIRSYHLEPDGEYELQKRQDDYYFTLISSMCQLMKDLFDENKAGQAEENREKLLDIAKGLLLYSDQNTQELFNGVNQVNNTLFVAAIYYVCQYEAIASVVLKLLNINDLKTAAGRKLFYIISVPPLKETYEKYDEIRFVDEFLKDGDSAYIENEIARLEQLTKEDGFETLREFFDSQILIAVLKKFLKHNLWTTLKACDDTTDWHNYIDYSKSVKRILSFLPSQEDAIENGLLTYNRSFCLGMSTSAGKSYITELIIYQELNRNPGTKVLYLAPLRSLTRELKDSFGDFRDKLHYKVRCNYGGHVSDLGDAGLEEASLIISTPEAFMSENVFTADFSLVICDEGQLIDDFSRGIPYELLLTRLKQLENIRFLFLSAIIPNLSDVNIWMGGKENEVGDSRYRPCRQRLGVVKYERKQCRIEMYDAQYNHPIYSIRLEEKIRKSWDRASKCVALAKQVMQAGTVMIYAYKKEDCKKLYDKVLEKGINCNGDPAKLKKTLEYCVYQLGAEFDLVRCLQQGFAYHHGNLPQDIRECVEVLLAGKAIKLIICNNTLAEGVNFPIRTLIPAYLTTYYDSRKNTSLPVGAETLKNVVGRVGRAGREMYGAILLPKEDMLDNILPALQNRIDKKVNGKLYDFVHSLEDISKWNEDERLVSAIDYSIINSRAAEKIDEVDPQKLAENTFAYALGDQDEKDWLITMYKERYNVIKERFDEKGYKAYKTSGLSIREIDKLSERVDEGLIGDLREYRESDMPDMVKRLIGIERAMTAPAGYEVSTQEIERIGLVAEKWMSGKTYKHIADECGMNVQDVILTIHGIMNEFAYKVQSILTYLMEMYEITNEKLMNIPVYMQHGICNEFMKYLQSMKLADRMAVHALDYVVKKKEWESDAYLGIVTALRMPHNKVEEEYIMHG